LHLIAQRGVITDDRDTADTLSERLLDMVEKGL